MKRIMLIISGILLIGIIIFVVVQQPLTSNKETANQTTQQEPTDDTKTDETNDQEAKTQDDVHASDETAGNPVTHLQERFNTSVQAAVQYFANRETHVTAIGDSLTQGVGDNVVAGGYVGILDDTINENGGVVSFDNYGRRGNRSGQLLERLGHAEVQSSIEQSDIVLITIGANDIMQVVKENVTSLQLEDFTPAKNAYEDRLHQIIDDINDLNANTSIYLIGIYNPFLNYFPDIQELEMIVDNWNTTGQDVTDQYDNVTFIPIADLFRHTDDHLFADDNFHPNHRGYQLFARRVMDYITDQ